MATAINELNDDEIEESLLWTDDEDIQGDIDPSDEELLLNDPIKTIASKLSLQNQPVNGDKNIHIESSIVDKKLISVIPNKLSDTLNSTIIDEVNLDVTIETRTALDTTVTECSDPDKTVVDSSECVAGKCITLADVTHSVNIVPEVTEEELKKHILNLDAENVINTSSKKVEKSNSVNSSEGIRPKEISDTYATIDEDVYSDSLKDSIKKEDTIIKTSEITEDVTKSTDIISDQCTATCDIKKIDNTLSSLKTDVIIDVASNNINKKGNATISLKRAKSIPLDDTINSDSKRIRQTSVPTTVSVSDVEFSQKYETQSKDKPAKCKNVENSEQSNGKSTKGDKPVRIQPITDDKKKQIVNFDIINYSKDCSYNPYVCIKCAKKVDKHKEFETHLIAHHAMSLTITDFNINLHQQYMHKREKNFKQGNASLPRLVLQEDHISQDIIDDYSCNVKYILPSQQYICKICENLYSSKNLIVEHLKSPKHLLKKNS